MFAMFMFIHFIITCIAAFLFRLVPVLRGGGLFGFGNYDDGVYYASATGLIHGLLPYRDFVLLHPPAMTALLAPFAAVAQLTSDSYGFAAARVAWMLLGGGERGADLENPETHRPDRGRFRRIQLCRVLPSDLLR